MLFERCRKLSLTDEESTQIRRSVPRGHASEAVSCVFLNVSWRHFMAQYDLRLPLNIKYDCKTHYCVCFHLLAFRLFYSLEIKYAANRYYFHVHLMTAITFSGR